MRRRREARTDYHQRLRLLKSGKPRLVARKSTRHVRAQLVLTSPEGDRTVASAHSTDLREYGWEAPTGNLPAAYLTGLLAGARAVAGELDEAVLDIGLNTATPGNKVFAVQEGAIDAGLEIPHNEAVFADWQRTRGSHPLLMIVLQALSHLVEVGRKLRRVELAAAGHVVQLPVL